MTVLLEQTHAQCLFPCVAPANSRGKGTFLAAISTNLRSAPEHKAAPALPGSAPPCEEAAPPGPLRGAESGHEAGAALPAGDPGPAAAAHRVSAAR